MSFSIPTTFTNIIECLENTKCVLRTQLEDDYDEQSICKLSHEVDVYECIINECNITKSIRNLTLQIGRRSYHINIQYKDETKVKICFYVFGYDNKKIKENFLTLDKLNEGFFMKKCNDYIQFEFTCSATKIDEDISFSSKLESYREKCDELDNDD